MSRYPQRASIFAIITFLIIQHSNAQELIPRRWSHLPMDTSIGAVAYVYTQANIQLDPLLQIEDLDLNMQTVALRYIRTFEILGKSSRFELGQSYKMGTWDGLLQGEPATAKRQGIDDTLVRLSTILYGAPPLKGEEYEAYRESVANSDTLIGVGLAMQLPTGRYSSDYLLNLGSNRFTFRPQLGITHQRGPWQFEASCAVWFLADNDLFWNETKREQKPFYTVQSHINYTIRPGVWLSSGVGYGVGGENTINGVSKNDRGENLAFTVSAGYSISRNMGFKLGYVGIRTHSHTGFDSNSIAMSFSVVW
jgi:hypothetical protein